MGNLRKGRERGSSENKKFLVATSSCVRFSENNSPRSWGQLCVIILQKGFKTIIHSSHCLLISISNYSLTPVRTGGHISCTSPSEGDRRDKKRTRTADKINLTILLSYRSNKGCGWYVGVLIISAFLAVIVLIGQLMCMTLRDAVVIAQFYFWTRLSENDTFCFLMLPEL